MGRLSINYEPTLKQKQVGGDRLRCRTVWVGDGPKQERVWVMEGSSLREEWV